MYATAAELAHCGTVASATAITTNHHGNVGQIKLEIIKKNTASKVG